MAQVHILPHGLELVIELIQGDGGDGVRFPEEELDLPLGGQGVDHVAHGAHQVDGIEHDDGLGAVGQADGDLVPGADADGFERPGAQLHLLDKIPVGGALAHEIIGDVGGVLVGHLFDGLEHGALEVIQVRGDVAQALEPGSLDLRHGRGGSLFSHG